jgi:hypothetical protein
MRATEPFVPTVPAARAPGRCGAGARAASSFVHSVLRTRTRTLLATTPGGAPPAPRPTAPGGLR